MTFLTPTNVEIGEGVTLNYWTDRHAMTVIEVKRNGLQLVVQRDKATRTNQDADTFSPGGFAGHTETPGGQEWAYERDEDGATFTANWSDKRQRFYVGGPRSGLSLGAGRHEHYDYNF